MKLLLVHWNESEWEERASRLRKNGHEVGPSVQDGQTLLSQLSDSRLDAVVIDLDRLPTQGRDVAIVIRRTKSSRHLPVIFVGGKADKVARVRESLPDAIYCTWRGIPSALRKASLPLTDPVVPSTQFAGYSGTPLPRKLGVKPNTTLMLINAPDNIDDILGELPLDVRVIKRLTKSADLIIWFVDSRAKFEKRLEKVAAAIGSNGLWIAWPKQASGMRTDMNQTIVRSRGLQIGLVDFKICAIDSVWSGLKFVWRKEGKTKG